MPNFANVHTHIDALEIAVQQVQSEIFRLEMQQRLSELRAMIDQIEQAQVDGAEIVVVAQAIEKMAKVVCWLDRILELFM